MREGGYTVIVHRDGELESRQWRLPRWAARLLLAAALTGSAAVLLLLALYGPIVASAAKRPLLEREVARLRRENQRVEQLARALDQSEARFAQLRGMLGAEGAPPPNGSREPAPRGETREYVAPPLLAREPASAAGGDTAGGPWIPARWPLSVPAYRTRGMAAGDSSGETHQGIDLAVPVGAEVRAAGAGAVKATGSDPAYGLFVLLEHRDGYESMYGHLSRVLVSQGDVVRAGQVIALSGNTGRSSAPHLHFEVRRQGRSVDPLSLVREGV
jgi:murein DD-endopeptidase MepM/ murein hydrolase activator NlpD